MFWDAYFFVPSGTQDGVNTIFTLPAAPRILLMFRNGLLLTAGVGSDFVLAGAQITFAVAPAVNDNLMALLGY